MSVCDMSDPGNAELACFYCQDDESDMYCCDRCLHVICDSCLVAFEDSVELDICETCWDKERPKKP